MSQTKFSLNSPPSMSNFLPLRDNHPQLFAIYAIRGTQILFLPFFYLFSFLLYKAKHCTYGILLCDLLFSLSVAWKSFKLVPVILLHCCWHLLNIQIMDVLIVTHTVPYC